MESEKAESIVGILLVSPHFYALVTDMTEKIKFRCAECGRLLAKVAGDAEIKCPRCGAINDYDHKTGKVSCVPKEQQNRTYRR